MCVCVCVCVCVSFRSFLPPRASRLRNIGMSRKFWSGENFGPGDQNSRKSGPAGPIFPENLGPAVE